MLPELASVLLSQFKNMIFKQSLVSITSGLSSPSAVSIHSIDYLKVSFKLMT